MNTYDGLWPLCETCGAVPTSHRDYRDCEAHMQVVAQAYNGGRENGGRQERVAVVAWLRGQRGAGGSALVPSIAKGLAHAIESGEHRREETK